MAVNEMDEPIVLDFLTAAEFRELCASIYRRLGYTEVEIPRPLRRQNLLLIDSEGTRTLAHCKNHPHKTIGKTEVEKLHSALVYAKADRGLLLTSGRLSKQAKGYARQLSAKGVPIQLRDHRGLAEAATEAGYRLLVGGREVTIASFQVTDPERFQKQLRERLAYHYPGTPADLAGLSSFQVGLQLLPFYRIRYDIHSVFRTSSGDVLHEVKRDDEVLHIEGINGVPMKEEIVNFVSGVPLVQFNDLPAVPVERGDYKLDETALREVAGDAIIEKYTIMVTYSRNNRTYEKLLKPKGKEIQIEVAKAIYLPVWAVKVGVINQQYKASFIENSGRMIMFPEDLMACQVCLNHMKPGARVVCNECGRVSHTRRRLDSHSFNCRVCGKTVCRFCARRVRLTIRRRILCAECTAAHPQHRGQSLPERLRQRRILGALFIGLGLPAIFFLVGFVLVGWGVALLWLERRERKLASKPSENEYL